MRLITSKGQLALPDNFSFSVEKESPFYGDNGTATIPVTLPISQDTLQKLGRPELIGHSEGFLRKLSAKLEAGIIHKDGVLIVDTVSRDSGISASLALDESDMYTSYKDKKLTEIFAGVVRDDLNSSEKWVTHLLSCAAGETDDWFTIATVAVNKEDNDSGTSYLFLNDVDVTSSDAVWPLLYKSRTIVENGESIRVPAGYGVAPFFYLGKFLQQLMLQMGYTLQSNKFLTDPTLKKIIMLHNAADALCKGTLKVSDIVPTCTLTEFLDFLNARFHAQVFVYPEQKVADLVFYEDILSGTPDMDLSGILDGNISITYPDPKQIRLESNNELDDADPAEDTFHEFVKKYPICSAVSEVSFAEDGLGVCLRKALGRFYRSAYNTTTQRYSYEHLGTNNFNYCMKSLEAVEYKAVDAAYGMISYVKDSAYRNRPIVAPYIGEKRHPNTSYNGETDSDGTQDIILAFAPGLAASRTEIKAGYYLATNQRYNNLGDEWNSWGLNYSDMYSLFWEKYNGLLQNAAPEISGKFDFQPEKLQRLRLDSLKFFRGQQLVMNSITYDIGRNLVCQESKYTVVPQLLNPVEDSLPVISEQLYKWERKTNVEDVLEKWSTQSQYEVKNWEYEEEQTDWSNTLAPPTELGQTTHHSEEGIIVTIKKTTSVDVITEVHYESIKVWYESVVK
ncbi:MAG: hypothetical protein IJN06_06930 [Bacteroidales bacterium]|nr:hypothetical protein [Bacteroidales bacterium]